MLLANFFYFLCAQPFSDINTSIIRSITILLNYHMERVFLVRCVLVFRCCWVGVVSVWQAEVACKTNLYCGILGYDTMQFDMYIQALPWKKFPQNYGRIGT